MKIPSLGSIESIAVLAAVAVGGYLLWRAVRGATALTKQVGAVISTDLNPASDKNLVYRSLNNNFFDDKTQTVGGKIYDYFHAGSSDSVANMLNAGLGGNVSNTPANGQRVKRTSPLRTSSVSTNTVDANPLVRTRAGAYNYAGNM